MTKILIERLGGKVVIQSNNIIIQPFLSQDISDQTVESDWSSVSYFYSLVALSNYSEITISTFFKKSIQGDSRIENIYRKFGVEIEEPTDNDMLSIAPKKQMEPQDMIPSRAQGDVNPNAPHRMSDLFEKMKKTGKLKKSELTEIIKKFK